MKNVKWKRLIAAGFEGGAMNLEQGYFITVRHYSMLNVFNSYVLDITDNKIKIKLPKECQKTIFISGDPVVVAYETDAKIEITGGIILETCNDNEYLVFEEDKYDDGMELRDYVRYPVSLYADIRAAEYRIGKKGLALVKDISEYGIQIFTKEDICKGQKIDLDVYLTRDILSLTAEIVRKTEHDIYYEYGLRIKHSGAIVFNHIKNVVKKAQEEHIIKFGRE